MKKTASKVQLTRLLRVARSLNIVKRSIAAMLLNVILNAYADSPITDLGTLGGNDSSANYISADGSTAVGTDRLVNGQWHIFKYTNDGGMIDIGTLGGGTSSVSAVSADGSTIVGRSSLDAVIEHAFKYTDRDGMVDLGTLGGRYSDARNVSADGSTVVGAADLANGEVHAFKHTEGGRMVDLGTLGGIRSEAKAVSANGSTVVGNSNLANGNTRAFKHTTNDGMINLGTLGGIHSEAIAVSADGSTVVGNSSLTNGESRAFKHTINDGMVSLGTLGGNSIAYRISADGSTVIGNSFLANGHSHAFKHTDKSGMVDLGTLGGRISEAKAVSADGSTVIGNSRLANNTTHAFKHSDKSGMVDLGTFGGNFSEAYGVSADGSIIVGRADTTNGETHAALWKDNTIVDGTNTRTALAQTAQQATQVLDMRSAQLQMLMQQDCSVGAGDGRFCMGAGATYSGASNAGSTAASITLGYQINPQWRIGTTVNQSLDSSLPNEYKSSNNLPGIGVFTTFNARKDGLGWQARVAAAYQKSKIDINRKQLSYTEGGIGRADIDGKAAAIEASYHMLVSNGIVATPYAALRYSSVHRGAYSESNGVAFVARYAEMGRSATSIEAGLRLAKAINDKFSLSTDIGVIRDISVNNRGFAVAMDYVGGFSFSNDSDGRTRAHLSLQGNYGLAKDSAIQGGIYWAQQPYGNDSTSAQIRLIRQF